MCKIYKYLYKLNTTRIVLFGMFLALFVNIFFFSIGSVLGLINEDSNINEYEMNIKGFMLVVILAPLIETIVFQYVPLKIAGLFIKGKLHVLYWTIICASTLFGLLHGDLILYTLIAFFYGLIWMCCCFLLIRKKQHPVLFTWLIHACYNGLLFGLTHILTLSEI